jgi:Ca2+/H+ antiporter
MCSGALKRKEQKFNAKSAGVTSTMLIMAIIGTLTPTMFYQTYGSVSLGYHSLWCNTADEGFSLSCTVRDVQNLRLDNRLHRPNMVVRVG